MTNNQISRLLEFVSIQMAAEAFLRRQGESAIPTDLAQIRARLIEGNTHASHFTAVQAEQFTAQYEVLAQYRNDTLLGGGTGFSGTLFKNRETGELTLSLRSTEFIDDAIRDTKATNSLEIKDLGWAFGQIAEMESWYKDVLVGSGGPLAGESFNVTGYSLGGHLATAFNILRRDESVKNGTPNPVIGTYTFNGAGTGGLKNRRLLGDVVADFKSLFTMPALTSSQVWLSLPEGERHALTALAQERVVAVNAEASRVSSLSAPFAFAALPPIGEQATLQYQQALLMVAGDTVGTSNFPMPGGTNNIPTSPVFASEVGLVGIGNMIEVVGSDGGNLGPSFISNSGIHYGRRQEIYIEDQPLTRGTYSLLLNQGSLISNPSQNDFADTHSLVLLVDSLALMAVMERLDPDFTTETAATT